MHCVYSDYRGVSVLREGRIKVGIREPGFCTQATLDLVDPVNVFGLKVHLLILFSRGCHVVKLGTYRGLLVDEVTIKIYEAKERLLLANNSRQQPVGEYAELREIEGHTGCQYYVFKI